MRRRIPVRVVALCALLFGGAVCGQEAPKATTPAAGTYDPHALQLLQEMTDAYGQLPSLSQLTEFLSVVKPATPLPSLLIQPDPAAVGQDEPGDARPAKKPLESERTLDRKMRLSYQAPNRLRLEVQDVDDRGVQRVSVWDCDGKFFWTYNPDRNLFSKEKAPAKIRDFARLAHMTSGSLEMLMLMGINPFAHIHEQADRVACTGKETVQGVETDVVTLYADLGLQSTETRLYIGAEDHLLHRLVSETTQKPRPPQRAGVGSPLDELAPPDLNPPPAPGPDGAPPIVGILMKSAIICDNKIDMTPHFDLNAFAYQPPPEALYLTNPEQRKAPMTLKQRIAELTRTAKRQKKAPPKIYRY